MRLFCIWMILNIECCEWMTIQMMKWWENKQGKQTERKAERIVWSFCNGRCRTWQDPKFKVMPLVSTMCSMVMRSQFLCCHVDVSKREKIIHRVRYVMQPAGIKYRLKVNSAASQRNYIISFWQACEIDRSEGWFWLRHRTCMLKIAPSWNCE